MTRQLKLVLGRMENIGENADSQDFVFSNNVFKRTVLQVEKLRMFGKGLELNIDGGKTGKNYVYQCISYLRE